MWIISQLKSIKIFYDFKHTIVVWSQMSVIKVIRLCDIMGLKPIINDPTMDLKVAYVYVYVQ